MATGTNGIATIGELMSGKSLAPPPGQYNSNRCPTAYEVSLMGGTTPGGYQLNRLVRYSDVTKPIATYILAITTTTVYSSLALFTTTGGDPYPTYSYILTPPVQPGGKDYIITFPQGSGINVNTIYPISLVTIYNGAQYRVMVKVNSGSPWTYLATLTHVDGNRSELI